MRVVVEQALALRAGGYTSDRLDRAITFLPHDLDVVEALIQHVISDLAWAADGERRWGERKAAAAQEGTSAP